MKAKCPACESLEATYKQDHIEKIDKWGRSYFVIKRVLTVCKKCGEIIKVEEV